MKIGSMFSGYGGLDLAVESVFGARTVWHAQYEPPTKDQPRPKQAPSKVLAAHWPGVPNHGDVTAIDWSTVEPVDILTGGFPCQDVSAAGKRAGMRDGTRSGLWFEMYRATEQLRPQFVVIENVRGLLSARTDTSREVVTVGPKGGRKVGYTDRALGRVLADLADLGYDARWCGLRAADVGAPHGRFRVFIVATHTTNERYERRGAARLGRSGSADGRVAVADASGDSRRFTHGDDGTPTDPESDGRDEWWTEPARLVGRPDAAVSGAVATDAMSTAWRTAQPIDMGTRSITTAEPRERVSATAWGIYEPAIRRWERTLGRLAPAPTEAGPKGGQRLSPRFVEWMQGLPAGWVTDVLGITRNDQLRMLGNGVVPQQAAAALRFIAALADDTVEGVA